MWLIPNELVLYLAATWRTFMKELLGKLFLNADVKRLGKELAASEIKGAEVVGRGTIVIDGKVIASSKEFQKLKEQATKIIGSREEARA